MLHCTLKLIVPRARFIFLGNCHCQFISNCYIVPTLTYVSGYSENAAANAALPSASLCYVLC
ncbi:hypothetical protein LUA82_00200 [Neoehrlichia mikurensis]|uniref:Uncharacterized protein n=1 Tax=Neoehrlichia mikurensis TaxID=89586 RepID=A0A9Q9BSC4_9RICK|nr:hypothetical protein [Neoehrlichia mikurensis]UTO55510.1 hypothetical protein LUA82_00200 [Neoehrlichia mikurensis]